MDAPDLPWWLYVLLAALIVVFVVIMAGKRVPSERYGSTPSWGGSNREVDVVIDEPLRPARSAARIG